MNPLENRLNDMGKPYREMQSTDCDYSYDKQRKPLRAYRWAAVVLLMISIYHYDTFAYYAQKLIGYDLVAHASLQELLDEGQGQAIGKSVRFSSGETLWLDRVMTDDNNTFLFAKITDAYELQLPSTEIKTNIPFFNSSGSSSAYMDEENHVLYWVINLKPPRLFEKSYTVSFRLESGETRAIKFRLNRLSSAGPSQKINIDQVIEYSGTSIFLSDLVLSPTSTKINGQIKSDATDNLDLELVHNGEKSRHLSSNIQSGASGLYDFEIEFEPILGDIHSLTILLERIWVSEEVNRVLYLDEPIQTVEDQEVYLTDCHSVDGVVHISLRTMEDVHFEQVMLNGKTALKETVNREYLKTKDGIFEERTLLFETDDLPEFLEINKMVYPQVIDHEIFIN